MDIRLRKSFILPALHVTVFCLVATAIYASGLNSGAKFSLCLFVSLQLLLPALTNNPVTSLYIQDPVSYSDQISGQGWRRTMKVEIELHNKRRLELTLKSFYCLWWIQILYLASSRQSFVVFVLPDTCTAEEHRHLRQVLNQQR